MESIRSGKYKQMIHEDDKLIELICKNDTTQFKKGEIIDGYYINYFGKVYGIVEDNIYFLTDENLRKYDINIIN